MHSTELIEQIQRSLTEVVKSADELRDLDQALGDGDLGITITLGAGAVIEALAELPDGATPAEISRACAKAFANANPSTMAALVAGGLLAGSKTWKDLDNVDLSAAARFVRAAGDNIAQRGKTQIGDKTIVDAIMPAADALDAGEDGAGGLDAAIAAAEKAVIDTRSLRSRRGRAAWLQERSIGLQDPGATAMWRFLESWRTASVAARS
ncbi:dihydroxyacetone kinase-like protein [Arthrobacter sp. V4I6]|uniref:DAK2 domain-containing protein n=1 Tax=unclassified Arthrobacter TaxID=235627 RepID=UPI00277D5EA6|nr:MULTISPECIES: DAK2 domain-containing protein [unclassified Arthrobacter]MDQ0820651.1 dihydroxyacetone kinase-like protein [Arthrobacter sp. V1I7]MDQ0854910.1 dihydroxyacetone kinase-like protein [Arthrobacter sp. V4I6]